MHSVRGASAQPISRIWREVLQSASLTRLISMLLLLLLTELAWIELRTERSHSCRWSDSGGLKRAMAVFVCSSVVVASLLVDAVVDAPVSRKK